jgi:hypothetical protein
MIKSYDYENFEHLIRNDIIPTFRTKADAQKAAKSIGWPQYRVIRVERRFEIVWVVGQSFFDDEISFPSFKWDEKYGHREMVTHKAIKKVAV